MNLNGAVHLLKDLGHPEKANDLLQLFIEQRSENRDLFDLASYAFADEITDTDLRAEFDEKYQSFKENRLPVEILVHIAKNDSWSGSDIVLLSNLSEEDFYAIFKSVRGTDISRVVQASIQFGRFGNADENMKKISATARQALVRIGKESKLNRRRVQQKFGVKVDD